jgi:hypothetical protein
VKDKKPPSLKEIQTLYRQVFGNEAGKEVLKDLNAFCCGTMTTAGREESIERLEGRREVFLQIMSMLKVDFEEVYDNYVDDF